MNPSRKRAFFIATVVFIVLLIIPVMIGATYYKTSESLTSQVFDQQKTLSAIGAYAIKVKLDQLVSIAVATASSTELSSDMANGQWDQASGVARDLQNNVAYYDPFIDRVIIFDDNGMQQAAYPQLTGGIGTSAVSSSWYNALNEGASSSVSGVIKRLSTPQIQVISIAVPVHQNGTLVGFIVLQVPTDNFLEFGQTISLGTYGFAYIVDGSGNIVAHPRYSSDDNSTVVNLSSSPIVQAVDAGESGVVITDDQGEESVMSYAPVPNYGWGLITQEPYTEAFSIRNSILQSIMGEIALMLGIDIAISYAIFSIIASRRPKKSKHAKR